MITSASTELTVYIKSEGIRMAASSVCGALRGSVSFQEHSSRFDLKNKNFDEKVFRLVYQATVASSLPYRPCLSLAPYPRQRGDPLPRLLISSVPANSGLEKASGCTRISLLGVSPSACHSSELAVVSTWDIDVKAGGSTQHENLLWMCGDEQISQECSLEKEIYADRLVDGRVSEDSSREMNSRGLAESLARVDQSPTKCTSRLEDNLSAIGRASNFSSESYRSAAPELDFHASSTKNGAALKDTQSTTSSSAKSQNNAHKFPALLVGDFTPISFGGRDNSKYEKELEVAVRAVQLSCILSQRIQQRVLRNEENTDFKKDRSLVTVADWGVQAVVSWVLSQAFQGKEIPMIAEEDTTGLRGMEKIDLLQRVVGAVNECLQHAGIVGVSPPERPLGAIDVLKAINKGSAEGGPKGRYWVLDPVDGTLGFVRGDQYALALALIEDGQVVLAVLGCPNFPLRKQWLVHHHRYYRIASRLHPPSPSKWHKGLILSATKGAGEVLMEPLVVNSDGVPQWDVTGQMVTTVSVSSIDDPAKATFCEPFEKANSSHSFTAGLAEHLGLRNRPLRVYSMAKYAAIARGDAEIFMKFAKAGYREKIWDHAAGVLIVQEAGGVVTDAGGKPLDFSQGRFLENLDRGIIACSGKTLHDKLLKAVDASWNSSRL
ncbi:hypothetical protein Mapa_014342 [Marchantia paleacea]|nr:hypothetical protein Mapa_014342 [Marchantia paleacea]